MVEWRLYLTTASLGCVALLLETGQFATFTRYGDIILSGDSKLTLARVLLGCQFLGACIASLFSWILSGYVTLSTVLLASLIAQYLVASVYILPTLESLVLTEIVRGMTSMLAWIVFEIYIASSTAVEDTQTPIPSMLEEPSEQTTSSESPLDLFRKRKLRTQRLFGLFFSVCRLSYVLSAAIHLNTERFAPLNTFYANATHVMNHTLSEPLNANYTNATSANNHTNSEFFNTSYANSTPAIGHTFGELLNTSYANATLVINHTPGQLEKVLKMPCYPFYCKDLNSSLTYIPTKTNALRSTKPNPLLPTKPHSLRSLEHFNIYLSEEDKSVWLNTAILPLLVAAALVLGLSPHVKVDGLNKFRSLRPTAKLLKDWRPYTLVPVVFNSATLETFVLTDFLQVYVLCSLGRRHQLYALLVYGLVGSITSAVTMYLTRYKIKRVYSACVVMLVQVVIGLVVLYWPPNPDQIYVYYIIIIIYGACTPFWHIQLHTVFSIWFEDKPIESYTIYQLLYRLSFLIMSGLSDTLCWQPKSYIIMNVAIFGQWIYMLGRCFDTSIFDTRRKVERESASRSISSLYSASRTMSSIGSSSRTTLASRIYRTVSDFLSRRTSPSIRSSPQRESGASTIFGTDSVASITTPFRERSQTIDLSKRKRYLEMGDTKAMTEPDRAKSCLVLGESRPECSSSVTKEETRSPKKNVKFMEEDTEGKKIKKSSISRRPSGASSSENSEEIIQLTTSF